MSDLRSALHISGVATSIRHGTAADRSSIIVLAPTHALDDVFDLAAAQSSPVLPPDVNPVGIVRIEGREAEVRVRGARAVLLRGRDFLGRTDDGTLTEGQLLQSDRLLLGTKELFDCVEDVLLPSLMDRRPPDLCVESIRKLAEARGIGEEWAMVVAAFQDPKLATVNEQFSAEDLGVIPPAVFESEVPAEPREAAPPVAPKPQPTPDPAPAPAGGGPNFAMIGGSALVVIIFATLAFMWMR